MKTRVCDYVKRRRDDLNRQNNCGNFTEAWWSLDQMNHFLWGHLSKKSPLPPFRRSFPFILPLLPYFHCYSTMLSVYELRFFFLLPLLCVVVKLRTLAKIKSLENPESRQPARYRCSKKKRKNNKTGCEVQPSPSFWPVCRQR